MHKLFSRFKMMALAILISFTPLSFADLKLNQDKSQLNFISIKNEHFAESHTFDSFSGALTKQGDLTITINIDSVNTIIPIRNERMRKMLFDAANYQQATFNAKVDEAVFQLSEGQTSVMAISGNLKIKNVEAPVTFDVAITALNNGQYRATTVKPTLINATSFELDAGIAALKEIAMLNSISTTVPLTFSVIFE